MYYGNMPEIYTYLLNDTLNDVRARRVGVLYGLIINFLPAQII